MCLCLTDEGARAWPALSSPVGPSVSLDSLGLLRYPIPSSAAAHPLRLHLPPPLLPAARLLTAARRGQQRGGSARRVAAPIAAAAGRGSLAPLPLASTCHSGSGRRGIFLLAAAEMAAAAGATRRCTVSSTIASSIESLSFINQDLHWKLQQRLATMCSWARRAPPPPP